MQLSDFRSLIHRLLGEVPSAYLDGIVAVDVSPKTVPHPIRGDVYTMGECIPLEWSGDGAEVQSRVVLYYGSFEALAHRRGFDWRREAWETLTHELRHHLEWRARVDDLEAYDWAADQDFARHEGQPFDPTFYRSGEQIEEGVYKVEDDVFVEVSRARRTRVGGVPPRTAAFVVTWHGVRYRVSIPVGISRPAFVILQGLRNPPPGQAVLVLPKRITPLDIFRRSVPIQVSVMVEPTDG